MPTRSVGLRKLISRIGGRAPEPARAHCANCGITIDGEEDERPEAGSSSSSADPASSYCCDGCSEGGPCIC